MDDKKHRTMARILADIADLGPFLPGSVRKDRRRYVRKDGTVAEYPTQARLNYLCGGRRRDKRIPAAAYRRVLELTRNYRRYKALVAELEEAAVRENLPDAKKKPLRRSGR